MSRRRRRLSNNAKVLLLACGLFTLITVSQYLAALAAHSLALAADCASMLADALSFLGNLLAECAPRRHKEWLELLMSALSLLLLGGFTLFFVLQAIDNIDADGSAGESREVDARIVVGFALIGLLFDMTSLVAFKVWHLDGAHEEPPALGAIRSPRTFSGDAILAAAAMSSEIEDADSGTGSERESPLAAEGRPMSWDVERSGARPVGAGAERAPVGTEHVTAGGSRDEGAEEHIEERVEAPRSNVNMLSAALHLVSDFARSMTTLVEGAVLIGGYGRSAGVSSAFIDGIAALVVCTLIASGFVVGCVRWVVEIIRICRRNRGDERSVGARRHAEDGVEGRALHSTSRQGSAHAANGTCDGRQVGVARSDHSDRSVGAVKMPPNLRSMSLSSSGTRHMRLDEGAEEEDGEAWRGRERSASRCSWCGSGEDHGALNSCGSEAADVACIVAEDEGVDVTVNRQSQETAAQYLGALRSVWPQRTSGQGSSSPHSSAPATPCSRKGGSPSVRASVLHISCRSSNRGTNEGRRPRATSRSGFRSIRREDSDVLQQGEIEPALYHETDCKDEPASPCSSTAKAQR